MYLTRYILFLLGIYMANNKIKHVTKSYSLSETQVEIIETQAQAMGGASLSAALRMIVSEWYWLKVGMYEEAAQLEDTTVAGKTGI